MNLAETWRIILKRWYVMVPMLLVALALTAGVHKAIAVKYQSTSMMSLLASQQATKGTLTLPGTGNPFLSFDSSLNDTADFLTRRVDSSSDGQQLAAEGVTGAYSEALAASEGPFMTLTVDGPNAATTSAEMTKLIAYTSQQLQNLQQQENVPSADMIRSAVIVPGSVPQAQTKSRLQDTLGAGVGGLALALLVTLAMHSVLEVRRRGRRSGHLSRAARKAREREAERESGPDPVTADPEFDVFAGSRDLFDTEHKEHPALASRLPDARD